MFDVEFSKAAEKDFGKLPRKAQEAFAEKIEGLKVDPLDPALKPEPIRDERHRNTEFFRIRAGDYRLVYRFDKQVLVVLVLHVDNRSAVYRRVSEKMAGWQERFNEALESRRKRSQLLRERKSRKN